MSGAMGEAGLKSEPLRVFVGTDDSQMVAARVLESSIRRHASRPVEFTHLKDLPVPLPKDKKNRPRTGFSFYRFLIPKLCGYQGRALYLDADMLVFADLAELWDIPFGNRKVLCTRQPECPPGWQNNASFHPGRQFSVMLLDSGRLDWDIESIVAGLDEGRYGYSQLMVELCLVAPDEIADDIPPDWNRLESYQEGKTKLLHYTVVSTQPWKSAENAHRHVWLEAYRRALRAGAVNPDEVLRGIECGFLHPSLAEDLPLSPAFRPPTSSSADASPADGARIRSLERDLSRARAETEGARRCLKASAERIAELEEALAALRGSWTWRIGRLATGPLGRLKRSLRGTH